MMLRTLAASQRCLRQASYLCPQVRVLPSKSRLDLTRKCASLASLPLNQTPKDLNITFAPTNQGETEMPCEVSALPNGLRIATQQRFGAHCTVGVAIHAGSRFEANFPSGVSNFIEKLGFQSTASFESRDALAREFERCRVIVDTQCARDLVVYAVSGSLEHVSTVVELLSEVVLQPRLTSDEVQAACEAVLFDRETGWLIPPPDRIMHDALHAAAFRANTLGHPLLCPEEMAPQITRQNILDYCASLFKPEHMVICGIGVPHELLLKATEKSFLKKEPSWISAGVRSDLLDSSTSQYTGGQVMISRDLESYHHPMPEYAHVSIGLQSASCVEDHFVSACVLQSLMGGGGSFSAGGPGKGMHTRLFTNVLNQYHWVNSAVCQNFSYLDNGLFAITGSAEPAYIKALVEVLCASFVGMAEKIHPEDLSRAKSQLKSNLLMSLESAPVLFEDVVRQVFAYGQRRSPQKWIAQIDAVKEADIHDFVQQMFQSKVSVAGFGKLGYIPSYDDVSSMLMLKKRSIPSLFSLEK